MEKLRLIIWVCKVHFRYFKILTPLYLILTLIVSVERVATSFILALIIDKFISSVQTNADISDVVPYLLLLVIVRLLSSVLYIVQKDVATLRHRKLNMLITRQMLYEKLYELDIQSLESNSTQNLVTRFNEYRGYLTSVFESILNFAGLFFNLTIIAIAIALLSPKLVLLLLITSLPSYIVSRKFLRELFQVDQKYTVESRKAYGVLGNIMSPANIKEVKLIGAFDDITKIFRDYFDSYFKDFSGSRRRYTIASIIARSISFFGLFIALYTITSDVLAGIISVGLLTFYFQNFTEFSLNIGWLLGEISAIDEQLMRVSELKNLMDLNPTHEDGNKILDKGNHPPLIEIKNASFKYPNAKKYVIEDLNLTIKPGEKVAIVGENGAGKTTLIKLLTRLYHVSDGSILIDKNNIDDLKLESWYKKLGVLFQDYNTYPDLSVFENITLGNSSDEIDYESVVNAAKEADADDFIQEYENKYSQILSEKYDGGIRPSTGQWQKISIARFFYRNAPILILDEPTASIDAVAEANIFNRIYEFMSGKTVIIISHRFSTVRNADRIIVFDKGKIVEEGNHKELLALNGKYAKAFRLQAKGYDN